MEIHSLRLVNFRLFKDRSFSFSPGMNWICGENGCGKTTLLEALSLLMTGRSFRTAHLKECIRKGCEHFFLEGTFVRHGVSHSLRLVGSEKEVRAWQNQTPLPSLNRLLGIILGAYHTPDDIQLVKGGQQARRRFLDVHLSQKGPDYLFSLIRYTKSLRQRNSLLKQKASGDSFFPWEKEMAKRSVLLVKKRTQFLESALPTVERVYQKIASSSEKIALFYPREKTEQEYLDAFERQRVRESQLGYSVTGPHRDALDIKIDGQSVHAFASEGEKRLICCALRLAEWEKLGEQGVFLLDDLALGFDKKREKELIELLHKGKQVFLTTPKGVPSSEKEVHLLSL